MDLLENDLRRHHRFSLEIAPEIEESTVTHQYLEQLFLNHGCDSKHAISSWYMNFDSRLLTGIPVVAAVVDAGTFAGAGKALGLTQSGVSRAIQRLEQRLGARLFERNAKVMRLTEAGKRFCEEVIPLMSRLEEAAEETVLSATTIRGRLRINVDPTFARLVLVPRLEALMATHPDLRIELAVRNELGDLIAEGFDAAIRFGEPQPSSLIVRRLL